jgi:hypothetical protein
LPQEIDNMAVTNSAVEAPLAGSLPPLDGVEPTHLTDITDLIGLVSEDETPCGFF